MPATYEPIATTTLGSASATIDFSSVPGTYTDLRLVLIETGSTAADVWIRFNSSSTGYSVTRISGNGSTATSARDTSVGQIRFDPIGSSATIPSLKTADIFSYASSSVNKSVLLTSANDRNTDSGNIIYSVGLWANSSAITSVNILRGSGNFNIGTTATLYGIKAA